MTNAAKVTRNPGRPALVHDPLPLFVKHPRERSWCGYQELMGMRRQYRILDSERLLVLLGKVDMGNFRRNYVAIEERIAQIACSGHLNGRNAWQWDRKSFVRSIECRIQG